MKPSSEVNEGMVSVNHFDLNAKMIRLAVGSSKLSGPSPSSLLPWWLNTNAQRDAKRKIAALTYLITWMFIPKQKSNDDQPLLRETFGYLSCFLKNYGYLQPGLSQGEIIIKERPESVRACCNNGIGRFYCPYSTGTLWLWCVALLRQFSYLVLYSVCVDSTLCLLGRHSLM